MKLNSCFFAVKVLGFLFLMYILTPAQLQRDWAKTYDGGSISYTSFDRVNDMHIYKDGSVILTGTTEPEPFACVLTTIKYSPQGDILWKNNVDASTELVVQSRGVLLELDQQGNAYLCYPGILNEVVGWVVLKYSTDGILIRSMIFEAMNDILDVPTAMVLDKSGHIVITGKINTGGVKWDCETIKADTTGNLIWSKLYDSGGWDNGLAISVDDSDNVYVTADATGFATDDDIVTLKYNPDGELQWAIDYNGGGDPYTTEGLRDDWPVAIHTDAIGSVYVTGYSQFEYKGPYGIVTIKYYGDGKELWQKRIENAMVNAMAVDTAGYVSIAGYTKDAAGWTNLLSCRYAPDGDLLWKQTYQGTAGGNDQGYAIITDAKDRTYVTGVIDEGVSVNTSLILLQYDLLGNQQSSDIFVGADKQAEFAVEIGMSNDNSIYIAGMDYSWATAQDYLLIKYSIDITEVDSLHNKFGEYNFSLKQNYPNPFNPTTTINYSVPKSSLVTIKLYDILGREIETLINEQKPSGNYNVQFNGSRYASGVYFYRMQAGNFVQTKKLVLMK